MELRMNFEYEQVWQLVHQLPLPEKQRLTAQLETELRDEMAQRRQHRPADEQTEFEELLLHGPVMSDEQFEQYEEVRRNFTKWIEPAFV